MLGVRRTGNADRRFDEYVDLLRLARWSVGYAQKALTRLRGARGEQRNAALTLAERIGDLLTWSWCLIDQTERRVLRRESVPAQEKVFSIFEPHTDLIVKEPGEALYGRKLYLSAGASGLITDCVIVTGNPADMTMAVPMLRRQRRLLGRLPQEAVFDGGFSSKENLVRCKELGIEDVVFSKHRGIAISEMTRSTWVYRCLRNFRAGIEGLISFLKRAFGIDRCTWKGAESFASYVLAPVLAGNLLTLARHLLS